jgi:hypothetical protein
MDDADEAKVRGKIEHGVVEIGLVMGPAHNSRVDDALGCESILILLKRNGQRFVEVRREPLDGDVYAWVWIKGTIIVSEIDRDGISRKEWRLGSLV